MVGGKITVTTSGPGMEKLRKDIEQVLRLDVLVGIPEDRTGRKDNDPINNAQLMYIHTNGSELRNIPRRPVIEPAIKAGRDKIIAGLQSAMSSAINGNIQEAKIRLKKVGQLGVNLSRAWFVDPRNGWPPNTPETIAVKGSDQPLIDTGQLRKSITFVVRERGRPSSRGEAND